MDSNNVNKPVLLIDGKGNRICKAKEPKCRRCGLSLKNKEVVYYCSASKDLYCSVCMHSKAHWYCRVGDVFNDEHIDWFSVLEVQE